MYFLGTVAIGGWALSMTRGSSLEAPRRKVPPQHKKSSNQDAFQYIEDEQNDSFKANDDWWKDPFAIFDEEEEGEERGKKEREKEPAPQKAKANYNPSKKSFNPSSSSTTIKEKDTKIDSKSLDNRNKVSQPANVHGKDPHLCAVEGKHKKFQRSTGVKAMMTGFFPSTGTRSSLKTRSIPSENLLLRTPSTTSPASAVAAPLAILLTTIPKIHALAKGFPMFKILCLLGLIRVIHPIFDRGLLQRFNHSGGKRQKHTNDDYSNEGQDAQLDGHKSKNDNGTILKRSKSNISRKREHSKMKHDNALQRQKPSLKWFAQLFSGSSSKNTLPPARELFDEIESLRKELSVAKNEKECIEREYETASFSLQETQNEVINLQSSSQYLKAQLRDSQEVMEKAIRGERRKAREELARMKEAMLQILQRERKELRLKLKVQQKRQQATNDESNNYAA